MKYIPIILFAMLCCSFQATAQADVIASFFEEHEENEDFTIVHISSKMFQMIAKLPSDDMEEEVRDVIRDLKGLRIMTTEENPNEHYNALSKKLNFSEYEELMKIRDEETNVRIMIKEDSADKINELLLLVGGEEEFVLISFIGNIDINKIAQLSGTIEINGIEYLDNLGGGN